MIGLELVDPEAEPERNDDGRTEALPARAGAPVPGVPRPSCPLEPTEREVPGRDTAGPMAVRRTPRPAAPELAAAVRHECLRRGLIVELGGRHASVVRLLPPLTITDEQAAAVFGRLADAVEAAARDHTGRGGETCGPRRGRPRPAGSTQGAG
jgi:diaminobutyrate-2-oxoglutarate transaminase